MSKALRKSSFLLLLTLMLCMLPACSLFGGGSASSGDSGGDTADPAELEAQLNDVPDLENPIYDNEQEGAEVREKKADVKDFYGKWVADSDRAAYLYGNLNIMIRPDYTWKANISEEDFTGKWEYNGTGITLTNEFITYDLFYAQDGTLMFRDHEIPDDMLVLTKAD